MELLKILYMTEISGSHNLLGHSALMTKAVSTSETSVTYQTTQRSIPEGFIFIYGLQRLPLPEFFSLLDSKTSQGNALNFAPPTFMSVLRFYTPDKVFASF
jgi:hypothetical protein